MYIDGKAIAADVRDTIGQALATLETPARLIAFVLSEDEATKQYIGIKEKAGKALGVTVTIERMLESTTTQELAQAIKDAEELCEGMIVQLPLPKHIDVEAVRSAIPRSRDIDCLGTAATDDFEAGTGIVMPPVVAAFKEILRRHGVDISGKKVVIIGRGQLVGAPAAVWFAQRGAKVEVLTRATTDLTVHTKDADIIVLGAGAPRLLTPDMIKEGVIILDAGTSESSGKVVGDADPACADRAALFTPVPGGIGPIAIAMLFGNLYTLATDR